MLINMKISRNLLVILGVLTFLALPASAAEGGTPILEELMKKSHTEKNKYQF